jgi:hypothetical protein
VHIRYDEEHRCAVLVHVAQQPAEIHVAHDVLDGSEGEHGVRLVVHRQEDAGDDHDHQVHQRQRAEIPEVVEIPGRREHAVLFLHHREDGQTGVDPVDYRILEITLMQTSHDVSLSRAQRCGGVSRP